MDVILYKITSTQLVMVTLDVYMWSRKSSWNSLSQLTATLTTSRRMHELPPAFPFFIFPVRNLITHLLKVVFQDQGPLCMSWKYNSNNSIAFYKCSTLRYRCRWMWEQIKEVVCHIHRGVLETGHYMLY